MDRGQVSRDAGGKAVRVVGVLLDITDLKDAEQRQRVLFDELNHRVKNTLSIVQALAQQTLRTRPEPADFARVLAGLGQGCGGATERRQCRDPGANEPGPAPSRHFFIGSHCRVSLPQKSTQSS